MDTRLCSDPLMSETLSPVLQMLEMEIRRQKSQGRNPVYSSVSLQIIQRPLSAFILVPLDHFTLWNSEHAVVLTLHKKLL